MSSRGVKRMKQIFKPICMLTLIKTDLTYHHLQKKADGGDISIENGAILNTEIHMWLHNYVEQNDIDLYNSLCECIQFYKASLILERQDLIDMYEQEVVPKVLELYNRTTCTMKKFYIQEERTVYQRKRTNNKEEQ